MRAIRLAALPLLFLAACGPLTGSAAADEAAALFDPGKVAVIKLTLPQKSREGLDD